MGGDSWRSAPRRAGVTPSAPPPEPGSRSARGSGGRGGAERSGRTSSGRAAGQGPGPGPAARGGQGPGECWAVLDGGSMLKLA